MYLDSLVATSVILQVPVVPAYLSSVELEAQVEPQAAREPLAAWVPQDAQELVLEVDCQVLAV